MNFHDKSKICKCPIPNDKNQEVFKDYCLCKRCGSIMIKGIYENITYILYSERRPELNQVNPIEMIKQMINNTKINYPHLNEEYNMNKVELIHKEESYKSINLYIKYRETVLFYLKKIMNIFDFNDDIFYQTLFFMDYIFSHHLIEEEITDNNIIYHLIGYFLCSSKMKDEDIFESQLNSFLTINENAILSRRKIIYYEILCLKSINYNLFSFSTYDWIIYLSGNGIVFDCEIDKKNTIIISNSDKIPIIDNINKYALSILLRLTLKNIFFKYSPIYIALSIIQISREKFLNKKLINNYLFNKLINIYGIHFNEYKNSYEEIKLEIEKDNQISTEDNNFTNIKGYLNKNTNNSRKNNRNKRLSFDKNSRCKIILKSNSINYLNENNKKEENNQIIKNSKEVELKDYKEKMNIKNNKNILKVVKHSSSITNENYTSFSNNNLNIPLIQIKYQKSNISIKDNLKIIQKNNSKFLPEINSNLSIKHMSQKKLFKRESRIIPYKRNNSLKINSVFSKFSPIRKKTLFGNNINIISNKNNINNNKFIKIQKLSKISLFKNKIEQINTNNKIDMEKAMIERNIFKLKKNFGIDLRKRESSLSISNKINQGFVSKTISKDYI